jgi:hypothetical protein
MVFELASISTLNFNQARFNETTAHGANGTDGDSCVRREFPICSLEWFGFLIAASVFAKSHIQKARRSPELARKAATAKFSRHLEEVPDAPGGSLRRGAALECRFGGHLKPLLSPGPSLRLPAVFDHPLQFAFADHGPAAYLRPLELAFRQPRVNRVLAQSPQFAGRFVNG